MLDHSEETINRECICSSYIKEDIERFEESRMVNKPIRKTKVDNERVVEMISSNSDFHLTKIEKDDYFKDFSLKEYRFIVVNNFDSPVPLVWKFRQTQAQGIIEIGGKKLRDPQTIGEELSYYLKQRPQVPLGVDSVQPNGIEQWFESHK